MYFLNMDKINQCTEIHRYCKSRCDEHIPYVENILNFSCFRDCVRFSNSLEAKVIEFKRKLVKWGPKKNDKCDYKPNGAENYRLCVITKVRNKGSTKLIDLKYLDDKNNFVMTQTYYPNDNIKKCGEKLINRSDCNFKKNL